jgi:hypothetical protein
MANERTWQNVQYDNDTILQQKLNIWRPFINIFCIFAILFRMFRTYRWMCTVYIICIYYFSFFWFFRLSKAFLYFRNALEEINFTKTQMYEKRLPHANNCEKCCAVLVLRGTLTSFMIFYPIPFKFSRTIYLHRPLICRHYM